MQMLIVIIITVEKKVEADSVVSSSLVLWPISHPLQRYKSVFRFLYNRDGETSPKRRKERKSLASPLDTQ